jgi:hypothetical protein
LSAGDRPLPAHQQAENNRPPCEGKDRAVKSLVKSPKAS